MLFYAHSAENQSESQWQTLSNHLSQVGEMAAGFAGFFGAEEAARHTGLLHDLGKYTPEFAARLRGGKSVDHATAGAKIAVERWGAAGKLMAFCIAGHHAGLANGDGEGDNRRTLAQRLALSFGTDIPDLAPVWQQEIALPEKLPAPPLKADAHHKWFSCAFFTRMLYSCLVDADFLDTEAFYASAENKTIRCGGHPDLNALQQRFNAFIEFFRRPAKQAPTTEAEQRRAALNRLRSNILDHAVAQAAGRCNREGKRLAEESFVWIFQPEAQWKAPAKLGLLSGVMRAVVRQHASDLLSAEAITDYFSEVYQLKGAELDQRRILAMHHNAGSSLNFPFQTIAAKFRMIETHMQPLIIPFDDDAEHLIDSLRHADQIGGLLRKLQPYTVQIPESALDALLKAGHIEAINEHTFGKQFYSLIGLDLYDEVAGFSWEDMAFLKGEELVL